MSPVRGVEILEKRKETSQLVMGLEEEDEIYDSTPMDPSILKSSPKAIMKYV